MTEATAIIVRAAVGFVLVAPGASFLGWRFSLGALSGLLLALLIREINIRTKQPA